MPLPDLLQCLRISSIHSWGAPWFSLLRLHLFRTHLVLARRSTGPLRMIHLLDRSKVVSSPPGKPVPSYQLHFCADVARFKGRQTQQSLIRSSIGLLLDHLRHRFPACAPQHLTTLVPQHLGSPNLSTLLPLRLFRPRLLHQLLPRLRPCVQLY